MVRYLEPNSMKYQPGERWLAEDRTVWIAGTCHETYTVFSQLLPIGRIPPRSGIPCRLFDDSGRAFEWLHGNAVPVNFWLIGKIEPNPAPIPCLMRV